MENAGLRQRIARFAELRILLVVAAFWLALWAYDRDFISVVAVS